jgi:hypothetical protein
MLLISALQRFGSVKDSSTKFGERSLTDGVGNR